MDRRTAIRIVVGTSLAVGAGGVAVLAGRDRTDRAGDDPRGADPATGSAPTGPPRPASPEAPARGVPADGPAVTLEQRCRERWGAAPPTGGYGTHTVSRLTVHHSAVAVGDDDWDPDRLRRYQRTHQDAGFVDLAYHLVVAPAGTLYEGRPVDAPGETFTDYDPSGHLHIVLDGHFDREEPTAAQLDTLVATLAWGAEAFDADPGTIAGHQDHAATACPGSNLQPLIADGTVRGEVESLIAAGGVVLDRVC